MARANILAQIANPQGGENVMRAYQQGTQMRYMQDERDRMQRQENALFQLAPMVESGNYRGAAAQAVRGGMPQLAAPYITLAQQQERENSFNNLLNPGGGGAGGVPPVSGGEPMPIVRPSMVAGSDAGSAAPQGHGQFTPQQMAEAQSRWSMGDESGAMDALYPKASDPSETERAFTDPAFKQHLIELRRAGATNIKIGEGQKQASVLLRTAHPAWAALTQNWDALADETSRMGKALEEKGLGAAGRAMQSPGFQVAHNAARSIIIAHGLATSGKTMSEFEIKAKIDTVLPKVGEPQEVTEQKRLQLTAMMDAIRAAAEGNYTTDEGDGMVDPANDATDIDALVNQYAD